jgi:hypothetical protein
LFDESNTPWLCSMDRRSRRRWRCNRRDRRWRRRLRRSFCFNRRRWWRDRRCRRHGHGWRRWRWNRFRNGLGFNYRRFNRLRLDLRRWRYNGFGFRLGLFLRRRCNDFFYFGLLDFGDLRDLYRLFVSGGAQFFAQLVGKTIFDSIRV